MGIFTEGGIGGRAGMRGSGYAVGMLLYVLGMMRCMDDKKVLFPFSLPPPSDFHALLRFIVQLFSHDL